MPTPRGIAGAVLIMGMLVGCGESGNSTAQVTSGLPREFRAVCGHPGASVTVRHVPVTVKHDQCDLTGVLIDYRNDTMRVPPAGQTYGDSVGLVVAVGKNGDVTVKADRNFGGDQ